MWRWKELWQMEWHVLNIFILTWLSKLSHTLYHMVPSTSLTRTTKEMFVKHQLVKTATSMKLDKHPFSTTVQLYSNI